MTNLSIVKHLITLLLFVGLAPMAWAAAELGRKAPALSVTGVDGKPVNLADYAGRWVVLEWTNPDCPFVQKHYNSGNMQATQKFAQEKQVVWIQINSTNPSHGDYKTPQQMAQWNSAMKAVLSVATLDQRGTTGKAYGAKTTPQIVLINPSGNVVYQGAIDSIRSANEADIPKAVNYVRQAITEVFSGKPVSIASSVPYGCSVKY